MLAIVFSMFVLVSACTSEGSSESVPDVGSTSVPSVDSTTAADLQARAFMRACRDVICDGAPILAPDSTADSVRTALLEHTDEVQYLSPSQIEAMYSSEGRFEDGATLIGVESVATTERADVRGVNVSISRGLMDFVARTYLFRWDGTNWVDTSADAVDVTVTSSVS